MTIGQTLLSEFDTEMQTTRRVLGQVPDAQWTWKIHEKSNTIGWLANHLAEIPSWVDLITRRDHFDIHPPGGDLHQVPSFADLATVLAIFDTNVAQGHDLLQSTNDETMKGSWTLQKQGENLMTASRIDCVRTWVMNHMIHHRGIMCVYLRVNNIPVPGIYGPSGDDLDS